MVGVVFVGVYIVGVIDYLFEILFKWEGVKECNK